MSVCSHSPCAEPGHTHGPVVAPFSGDTQAWKGHRGDVGSQAGGNAGHPGQGLMVLTHLQTPFSHGNDPPASFLSTGLALQHLTRSRDLAGARARVQLPVPEE